MIYPTKSYVELEDISNMLWRLKIECVDWNVDEKFTDIQILLLLSR